MSGEKHNFIDEMIIRFPARYIQGDERISGKIDGLLLFNQELERLEFLIQPGKERAIIISYPIRELRRIEILPLGISKKKHIKLIFNEEKGITPTFKLKDEQLKDFIEKIKKFREDSVKKPTQQKKEKEQIQVDPMTNMITFFTGIVKNTVGTLTKTLDQSKNIILNIFNQKEKPIPLNYELTTINGIKCAYIDSKERIHPKNEQIAVIVLHPLGGTLSSIESILSRLDIHNYRVLAHELRGHGMTIGDQGRFSLQDYVNDLHEFISSRLMKSTNNEDNKTKSTAINNLIIISHSLNTAIILEFLLRFNDKNTNDRMKWNHNLILLSAGHFAPSDLRKKVNKIPPPQLWRPFKRIIFSRAKDYLVHPKNQEIAENFLAQCVNVSDKAYHQIFRTFLPNYHYQEDEWKKTRKKINNILILRGDHDLIFSKEMLEETSQFFSRLEAMRLLKFETRTISESGHLLPLEQPRVVSEIIDQFIKKRISVTKGDN